MKKDKRFSLADKVALFFILVMGFFAAGLYYNLKHLQQSELLSSSRVIAKMVDALLTSSDEVKGLWVLKTNGLSAVETVSGLSEKTGEQIDLYRIHDPEFAKFVAGMVKDTGAEINFDLKSVPPGSERWQLDKGIFSYEKPLLVKRACVTCHEASKGKAPALRLGEAAGTIKIKFYNQNLWSILGNSMSLAAPLAFLVITVILYALVRFELLKPLSDLTKKVHEMSLGNLDVDLGVKGLSEDRTRDEIIKLAISIERLRRSQKTMEKMLDDDSLIL
ncbi:HAMP domain-containing protein [Thermodesulfatator atlanticus]|uniref:HAMP domain-containing protein n=1 Tax=Thermodesulfatator atlanticus TaxID=501497 RepID=UPI0003B2F722|nr:hypothetical protein [Thermodesulfatator atlanticus]